MGVLERHISPIRVAADPSPRHHPPAGMTAAILREMSYSTLRFGLYEPIRDALDDKPETNAALFGEEMAGVVRIAKRMFAGL